MMNIYDVLPEKFKPKIGETKCWFEGNRWYKIYVIFIFLCASYGPYMGTFGKNFFWEFLDEYQFKLTCVILGMWIEWFQNASLRIKFNMGVVTSTLSTMLDVCLAISSFLFPFLFEAFYVNFLIFFQNKRNHDLLRQA